MSKPSILLAFSGGLDTSAIIPWLIEKYDANIIAYCADLGNAPDGEYLAKWSKKLGASEFIFEDLKEEFTQKFVFPAIQAGAIYQDDYLLGTALGRPLIAERMAFYAKKFNCYAIAHGATGKGNDQVRFEKAWAYLVPNIKIIAPWKMWDFKGRKDLHAYLESKGLDLVSEDKKYSVDCNLLHRSTEGNVLEDPEVEFAPKEVYRWVKTPAEISPEAINITLNLEKGTVTKINNEAMTPAQILTKLNELGGQAGIGVVDLVEGRGNGVKSRGIYETPGGSILHFATKQLKHYCWDRSLLNVSRNLGEKFAEVIYDGEWHSETTKAILSYFSTACQTLTGSISLKLIAGQMIVTSRKSSFTLYDEEGVTFESDEFGLHKYAEGYCKTISYNPMMNGKRDLKNGIDYLSTLK